MSQFAMLMNRGKMGRLAVVRNTLGVGDRRTAHPEGTKLQLDTAAAGWIAD